MLRLLPVLGAWVIFAATSAHSGDLYRCLDEHGALSFVDRPEACEGGELQEIQGRIEIVEAEAHVSRSAELPASPAPIARNLQRLLLSAQQAGPGWELVAEAPRDVLGDADFISWGVRDQRARHYTRDRPGMVQVCSIEIWRFNSLSQARVAAENISFPEWQIDRADELLVMIHGMTRAINKPPRRGVFPACNMLGAKQRQRLAEATSVDQ